MRVLVSGSPKRSSVRRLNWPSVSSIALRFFSLTPGGFCTYSTGSPTCRSTTPEYLLGRKPLDHIRVNNAWAAAPDFQFGVRTTNAGRSLLSQPRPYDSHEPRLGLPGTSAPVIA